MATEPAEYAKTPAEIYALASRSEQVIEAAKLLEYTLREYSGDYRSGFTQLYNGNRKLFEKALRDQIRVAFEVRNKLRNVARYGEPTFEAKTTAAETFVLAAQTMIQKYPQVFPEKFQVNNAPPVQDSAFFDQGFESHPGPNQSNPSAYEQSRQGAGSNGAGANAVPPSSIPIGPNPIPVGPAEPGTAGPTSSLQADGPVPQAQSLNEDEFVMPDYQLPSPGTFFNAKLKLTQLEKISHRMGRSLKAGVSIIKALENESKNLRGALAEAFEEVIRDVSRGETLADSVSRHYCFPPTFCEMVRAGEEAGRLDQALLRLADHYRHLIQMRRTFISGITWPVFQLCAAIGVISLFFIALSVLESMLTTFKAPDIFMLGLGPIGNLFLFWTLLIVGGIMTFLAVKGIANGWFGEWPMRAALRIPLIGNTIRILCLSRFAWSFGMAIETGMDATRAIRLGVRSTNNHYYKVHEDRIAASVGQGNDFYSSLDQTDAFPEDLLQAVEVGETTGELTECLERLSDDYREQAEINLKRISQISGMVIWLFISGVIIFLIFLMYMNYIGMINEATSDTLGASGRGSTGELVGNPDFVGDGQDAQRQIDHYTNAEKSSNPVIAARNQGVKNILENTALKDIIPVYQSMGELDGLHGHDMLDKILEPFDKMKK